MLLLQVLAIRRRQHDSLNTVSQRSPGATAPGLFLFCRNAAPLWFFYGLGPHLKCEDIRCFVNVHRGRARERPFRLRCNRGVEAPSPQSKECLS